MNARDYLTAMRENIPAWLADFPKTRFSAEEFFNSRVVYYPGSGTDGHAVKLFGGSHSAHCFVYVDYGVEQTILEQALGNARRGFKGYHRLARVQLSQRDLIPSEWLPHDSLMVRGAHGRPETFAKVVPYAFLEILERNAEMDDGHGARRLAIIFLCADGIASYDALFCQRYSEAAPFAVLLQDHGFGGNWDKFGGGGLLEGIAIHSRTLPKFLVVATENTQPWAGFTVIPGVQPDKEKKGCWGYNRSLYQLDTDE